MASMTKRIVPLRERIKRQFHSDVRKLKKECREKNINLMTYAEACVNDICVLSEDEYEIGNVLTSCDPANEAYFLNEVDYEKIVGE